MQRTLRQSLSEAAVEEAHGVAGSGAEVDDDQRSFCAYLSFCADLSFRVEAQRAGRLVQERKCILSCSIIEGHPQIQPVRFCGVHETLSKTESMVRAVSSHPCTEDSLASSAVLRVRFGRSRVSSTVPGHLPMWGRPVPVRARQPGLPVPRCPRSRAKE